MHVTIFGSNLTIFVLTDPKYIRNVSILEEYYILLTVEMVIIVCSVFVKSISLWVQLRFGNLHKNLSRIFQFVTLMENLQNASQFLLLLVQIRVVPVQVNSFLDLLVLLCSILRSCMIQSRTFTLACFLAERAFSVYFLVDYEKAKRQWIWISIVIIHSIFAGIFALGVHCLSSSLLMMYIQYSMYGFLVMIGVFSLFYLWLLHANVRKRGSIKDTYKEYTLSVRFQLEENQRAFQIMTPIYLSTAINTLILCLLCQCSFWFLRQIGQFFSLFMVIIDIFFVGSDLVAQFIYLLLNRSYRESFFIVLGEILSIFSLKYSRFANQTLVVELSKNSDRQEREGDVYFDQFKAAWA